MKYCKRGHAQTSENVNNAGRCKQCRKWRLSNRYHNAKSNARHERGLVWELTYDQYKAIVVQPCAYGQGITQPSIRMGVDRKDNSKGYTAENSVPCCGRHNSIKAGYFAYEEMLWIVRTCPSAVACGNRRYNRDEE